MSARARVAQCLATAAQDGYRVAIVEGRVRVRRVTSEGREGRSLDRAWRAELRVLDPVAVARVLAVDVAHEVARFDEIAREAFEERAAIAEHDGGLPRDLAERAAWCWCSEAAR